MAKSNHISWELWYLCCHWSNPDSWTLAITLGTQWRSSDKSGNPRWPLQSPVQWQLHFCQLLHSSQLPRSASAVHVPDLPHSQALPDLSRESLGTRLVPDEVTSLTSLNNQYRLLSASCMGIASFPGPSGEGPGNEASMGKRSIWWALTSRLGKI